MNAVLMVLGVIVLVVLILTLGFLESVASDQGAWREDDIR